MKRQTKMSYCGSNRTSGQHRSFSKQHAARNSSNYFTPPTRNTSRLPTPEDFYEKEIDGFSVGSGGWASGCCPFHDDHNPSFAMNLDTGSYFCRSSSCGAKGGSLISFVCELYGLSRAEAQRFLENWA